MDDIDKFYSPYKCRPMLSQCLIIISASPSTGSGTGPGGYLCLSHTGQ